MSDTSSSGDDELALDRDELYTALTVSGEVIVRLLQPVLGVPLEAMWEADPGVLWSELYQLILAAEEEVSGTADET